MRQKVIFIILIGFLTNINLLGQENSKIYNIEKELMLGDKKALFEISPYFDSKKELTEFLGYHILKHTESGIAKRIVVENCIFTEREISISEKTTSKEFTYFLNQNRDKISFSEYAQAFLITPLENRTAKFDIRKISENKNEELKQHSNSLLNLDWVKSNKIDVLIKEKNPKALLLISSELFKYRYRFNSSFYKQDEFIDLIRLITGTDIAVENKENQLTWYVEKEFYPNAYLNLLIYFSNNYTNYKWDDKKAFFINQNFKINTLDKEELLFELLNNKNDSIANDAFKQLSVSHPEKVIKIANQHEKSGIKFNYAIPTFPYKFLKQLVVLTEYCKNNNIDIEINDELKEKIKKLQTEISFSERRVLENQLIQDLTLEDITAFEFYSILNENSFQLTYSAGRILDVFYSKNWNDLLSNEKYLSFYLKKSLLFDRLGIIGICNNYLKKFQNSNTSTINKLDSLKKTDIELNGQIEKAIKICHVQLKRPKILKKEFEGNKDYIIKNLENEFSKIKKEKTEEYEDQIISLLSKINYSQIGKALELIENIQLHSDYKDKYSFIERDFGFFWIKQFDDKNKRTEFIKAYNQYSEYDFYTYHLKQSGIDYLNEDNTFNYDKIYELLKYDVVVAFVGGGGGKNDNEVYSLIKLLEIKYRTTLGYPKKVCNSDGMYACYSDDRANEWMQFFIDKKLLKFEHKEPISFNYE